MLLRFSVANFRSFWREQQLSMIASSLKDDPSSLIEAPGLRGEKLLPSAVIYGANASGKSNLLKALEFMQSAIRDSHSRGGPVSKIERKKFALDPDSIAAPSRFSADFLHAGVRYEYGFEALDDRFEAEWLHWWPSGVRASLFRRKKNEFEFGRSLNGRNRLLAGLTRSNSLFVSVATQNNHEQLTETMDFFNYFIFGSREFAEQARTAATLGDHRVGSKILSFLREIRTGISAFRLSGSQSEYEGSAEATIDTRETVAGDPKTVAARRPATGVRFGRESPGGETVWFEYRDESDGHPMVGW